MPRQTSRGKMTVRMKVPSPRKHSYRGATNVYRGSGSSPKKRSYTKKTSPRCGSRSSPRCGRSYRGSSSPKRRTYRGTTYRGPNADVAIKELTEKLKEFDVEEENLTGVLQNLGAAIQADSSEQLDTIASLRRMSTEKSSFWKRFSGESKGQITKVLASLRTVQQSVDDAVTVLDLIVQAKGRKARLIAELEKEIRTLDAQKGELASLFEQLEEDLPSEAVDTSFLVGTKDEQKFVQSIQDDPKFQDWLSAEDERTKDELREGIKSRFIQTKTQQLNDLIATTKGKAEEKAAAEVARQADPAKERELAAAEQEVEVSAAAAGAGDPQPPGDTVVPQKQ